MGYRRTDVEDTALYAKKFVRYEEGAKKYSMGICLHGIDHFTTDTCTGICHHRHEAFYCHLYFFKFVIVSSTFKTKCTNDGRTRIFS